MINAYRIHFVRLGANAKLPTYATPGAACFDIYAAEDVRIIAGSSNTVHTHIGAMIPPSTALLVFSRSGHGKNHGISLANGTGIIDSDYQGEIQIILRNSGTKDFFVYAGDRIAQGLLIPAPQHTLVMRDQFDTITQRGAGGFGSTGA